MLLVFACMVDVLRWTLTLLHVSVLSRQLLDPFCSVVPIQARSQPARWGGSELGWVEHQAHPPPFGHCPRDVINLKNAPTLGHSQAPPLGHCPRDVIRPPKNWKTPPLLDIHKHHHPLDIARVTSSTYSKGGTKLLKGGTKLLKGGTKLLKGGTKLLKGGTKSLGWATGGGGRPTPPTPPLATGLPYNVSIFHVGSNHSFI